MKKTLLYMALAIAAFAVSPRAMGDDIVKYGFYVAGVEVTSRNCSNITSNRIEAWDTRYPCSAVYTPSTKTLRLDNVKIERTGTDNRALRNVSCNGLTVVFGRFCILYAEDSSPVSLETNTTFKCEGGMWDCDSTYINGLREDAISLRNDATLTIEDAYLDVRGGNSSAFWCDKDNRNKIIIRNSIVTASGKNIFEGKFISIDTRTSQFFASATDKIYTSSTTPAFYYTTMITEPTSKEMMYDTQRISTSSSAIFPTSDLQSYVSKKYDRDKDQCLTSYELRRIKWFTYVNKGLKSVPFLKYFKVLRHLDISENELGDLDLSANKQLEEVRLYDVKLTSLNLSGLTKLTTLYCGFNQLKSLDISQQTNLTSLNCYWNELTSLNTSNNTKLESLTASRQRTLTSIDVTRNTKLKSLDVGQCGLSSLDVTRNTELTSLDCRFNEIAELNLNNNNKLENIETSHNQLTSLILPQNATNLTKVDCSTNRLSSIAMQQVVSRLPRVTSGNFIPVFADNDGNICLPSHVDTATRKGWTVKKAMGGSLGYEDYNGILEYNEKIAGVAVTNLLCEDLTRIPGVTKNTPNAIARYLPYSHTFQLSGVSINDEQKKGIHLDNGGTIELTGEPVFLNKYSSNGSDYQSMNFYIKGTGELIITSTMYLCNKLNLQENCMVYVDPIDDYLCISGSSNAYIDISDNAQLRLYSDGPLVRNLYSITGRPLIPQNMYFDRSRGDLQYTDQNNPVSGQLAVLGNVHQLRTVRFKNYDWPTDFEHGDYYASIYGYSCYLEGIQYSLYGKILDLEEEYANAGDNIGIGFTVQTTDEALVFHPDVQAFCDNKIHTSKINISDSEKQFIFAHTVPTPDVPPVKLVDIDIPIPHDGETPTWDLSLPSSTRDFAKEQFAKKYTIDQVIWKKGDNIMSEGETFEMGEEYTAEVRVSPKSGYQWHHNTAYIINDMDVPEENILDISSTQKALIYNFGITDPDGINDIIAGNKADNTYYTLDGRRIIGKPTQKGIYINNGKKVSRNL